jgi:hypothetical protein
MLSELAMLEFFKFELKVGGYFFKNVRHIEVYALKIGINCYWVEGSIFVVMGDLVNNDLSFGDG